MALSFFTKKRVCLCKTNINPANGRRFYRLYPDTEGPVDSIWYINLDGLQAGSQQKINISVLHGKALTQVGIGQASLVHVYTSAKTDVHVEKIIYAA